MAGRIRNIKPELRELAEFASLTDGAARLFLMLYTLADDEGVCPAGASYMAGAVFFGRPRTPASIGRLFAELEAASLIRKHTISGSPFVSIVGWRDKGHVNYQFIKKPIPFRYCAPGAIQSTPQSTHQTPPQRPPSDSDSYSDSDVRDHSRAKAPQEAPRTLLVPKLPDDYDHNDPPSRGRLAERAWRELDAARQRVAMELGRTAPFPLQVITPGSEPRGFRDLRDRIREEGALAPRMVDAILKYTAEQAIDTGDAQWLSEKLFTEGAWRTARAAASEHAGVTPITAERKPARSAEITPGKGALAIFGDDDELAEVMREAEEAERAAAK